MPSAPQPNHTCLQTELRSGRRIPLQCYVKICVPERGDVFYGLSKDISVGGLSFTAAYVPKAGEIMEVHLQAPVGSKTKPLKAQVRVRRCQVASGEDFEIGTQIVKIRS